MGVGWGAAALVGGMAIVVVLGLVLVSLANRPGSVWLPTTAVLLGMAVVAGTAWLVFAPVTYESTEGTVTCHSPTTANKKKVGYDGGCQSPAMQRRWVVFGPLVVVGAASLVGLIAPGLRHRDEVDDESEVESQDEAGSEAAEAEGPDAGALEDSPRPSGTTNPLGQHDQPA